MKLNRAAHLPWAIFVLAVAGLASLFYVANFHPERVPPHLQFFGATPPGPATRGGNPLGLVLGTIAFVIFLFAGMLGMRKRMPRLFPGHVQTWLRAHIWLTLLTIPLILLHSGFQFGSPMTTMLMGLYAVVMLSGIYGLILQQRMPTKMKDTLPREIVYEQIPNLRAQLRNSALRLRNNLRAEHVQAVGSATAAASSVPVPETSSQTAALLERDTAEERSERRLLEFIERKLLPYLEANRGEKLPLGHAREAKDTFHYLRLRVAEVYRSQVDEMEAWTEERRLLDEQTRMHHRMHGWLFVHAPLSFLLILFTAWHAFVTLFRY